MNVKSGISRYVIPSFFAAAMLMAPTACDDDLGHQNNKGEHIVFNPVLTDTWSGAMSVDESSPTTHCTSVRELSGGDSKLYLHTVVAENPAEKKTMTSRGALIKDKSAFYKNFSLSGVCYTGDYNEAEVTPNYAYNRCYSTETGLKADDGMPLRWPSGGKVRFFAFAPTRDDFNKNKDGSMLLSGENDKGSPKLTYTVPKDVEKQIDLMTVSADVTKMESTVNLNFTHALTAIQIKCGDGMLAFTVTGVSICNIHSTGTTVIGSNEWTGQTGTETYSIEKDITLSAKDNATDKLHVDKGTPITGTDTDNLTFLLLPQTLPDDAEMVITLKNNEKPDDKIELKASLNGEKWEAGKIVSYSVSPNDIKVSPKLTLDKKGATSADEEGDIMPYSGVWYDAIYTATAEITKKDSKLTGLTIPKDKIKFQYKFDGENDWKDCPNSPTEEDKGFLSVEPQEAYKSQMQTGFKTGEAGSKDNPQTLTINNETANCYMVDQAGYYSLPLVYGNRAIEGGNVNALKYYPNHDNKEMTREYLKDNSNDAVLVWQDSPDLIDPTSVQIDNGNIVFRIREKTLAQGNAVVAVRNSAKIILWSWHIWVTPYKKDFYDNGSALFTSKTTCGTKEHTYKFAPYNLGWCDPHRHNEPRQFQLRAIIDMSAYGGSIEEKIIDGAFTLMEFKGSNAGDNTYYQWGRKDPMLGGIYNDNTPIYSFHRGGPTKDGVNDEFNMENKQIFNQYNKDGKNYSFCKNPGDLTEPNHQASKGVTIGYAIQHPFMFVTNSKSAEIPTDNVSFNYRNHWHRPYADTAVVYLSEDTHILFNAWNKNASEAGLRTDQINNNELYERNATEVEKSVYDPCPPKFKLPPIDAFRGIAEPTGGNTNYNGLGKTEYNNYAWTIKFDDGRSIKFPATGVRDYAIRSTEMGTVEGIDNNIFYSKSWPAFRCLTFVSSATIAEAKPWNGKNINAYQLLIFSIDNRKQNGSTVDPLTGAHDKPAMNCFLASSNSYGLSVRPVTSDSE